MANYLVTGAAGFIGSHLSEMLIGQGHAVTGVDNLNNAYDVRMKEYRLHKLQTLPGLNFLRLDISDKDGVARLPAFEAVIHLAARAGVRASVENPWAFYETNLNGTLNLLELCRQRKIDKFLMASTSSIYGADPAYPTPETASSSEVLCHAYHHLYGIDVSVVRYFTVYGPAGRPDMSMFRFVKWICEGEPLRLYGDGSQSRGFTYVDDIARGSIAALRPLGYEIINLGGHEVISMSALIAMIEGRLGKQTSIEMHPPNPADMLTSWADVNKARHLLDWQPDKPGGRCCPAGGLVHS
jgi:UDP-glucuronate 4-epimerase